MTIRERRKEDHISLAVEMTEMQTSNGFEEVHLVPDSVTEINMEAVKLDTHFLGKRLGAPLLINAITGGTQQGAELNASMACMAAKYRLAMAVGSQQIVLDNSDAARTFHIARENNPDGIIIANVPAAAAPELALRAVGMLKADGLQLHFNTPQELAMREGERSFGGLLDNVRGIRDVCPVPLIAKEVGFGFSRESITRLHQAGIDIFDCSGRGGTNFIAIENRRQGMLTSDLNEWGLSSAASLAEAVDTGLPVMIISSGGMKGPLDAAKALAMGAHLVGLSGILLNILVKEGLESLDEYMERFIYSLRAVFLMSGAVDLAEMQKQPVIITGRTRDWLKARGINPEIWARQR